MTGWRELAIGINAAVVFAEYTPAPTPAARLPPARPTRPAGGSFRTKHRKNTIVTAPNGGSWPIRAYGW